jgi:diguanylate cyclase (GGDEF)-like protein
LGIGSDITERKRLENTLRTNEAQSSAHSRLLQAVLESSPGVIVFALDQDYRYLAFNEKHRATMHAIWGKEIAVGMNMLDVIGNHPDREKAKFGFDRALSGEAFVAEDAYGDKGILRMFWQNFFAPIRDEDGSAIGLTCFVLNITERRQLELRISARDAMLEMVSRGDELAKILNAIVLQVESEDNTMLCSVLLLDKEGTHLLNGAAPNLPVFYNQAIHGIEIGEGVGSCGTAAALGQRVIVEDIQTHAYWQPYAELAHQAGLRSCWSEPIHSSHGKVLGTFAIYHAEPKSPQPEDIERIAFAANLTAIAIESRYAHDELEQRAYTDYLTGLANRRYFLEQAENELARTLRYGRELSILMLDVDRFKQVNDTYGHKVGDLVLQKLSEVFRTTLRDVDIIGRVGGEEFALLLPETGVEQAMQAAERLRTAIASAHVTLDGGLPLRFTASFGVTNLREKDVNIDVLLNQADQALYRAKNGGRNRVCMYLVDEADQ